MVSDSDFCDGAQWLSIDLWVAEVVRFQLAHIRVEHADAGPVGFVCFDELQMSWVDLVVVVSLAAVKDNVQADVKCSVVDRSSQVVNECSGREENFTRMSLQELVAGIDKLLLCCRRSVFEREENIMSQHLFRRVRHGGPLKKVQFQIWSRVLCTLHFSGALWLSFMGPATRSPPQFQTGSIDSKNALTKRKQDSVCNQ